MQSPSKTHSINIIGAGSIGHLWSAYLIKAGYSTTLFTPTPRKNQTVFLKAKDGQFKFEAQYDVLANWSPANTNIVAVKAGDLETVCRQIAGSFNTQSNLILMMNGLGLIEVTNQYLPEVPVFQASTTHGALYQPQEIAASNPPIIHHTGRGETKIGGIKEAILQNDPLKTSIKILNSALPKAQWNEKHQQTLWTKLIINAVINPLTAINDVSNGHLISDADLHQQAKSLTYELQPLIEKFLPDLSCEALFSEIEKVIRQTGSNSSSMRQDIHRERKTEIDFISGYILRTAHEYGWNFPKHQKLIERVKNKELQILNSVTK